MERDRRALVERAGAQRGREQSSGVGETRSRREAERSDAIAEVCWGEAREARTLTAASTCAFEGVLWRRRARSGSCSPGALDYLKQLGLAFGKPAACLRSRNGQREHGTGVLQHTTATSPPSSSPASLKPALYSSSYAYRVHAPLVIQVDLPSLSCAHEQRVSSCCLARKRERKTKTHMILICILGRVEGGDGGAVGLLLLCELRGESGGEARDGGAGVDGRERL